ncbi:MAG: alpha-ribazole phosphatase [Eubacterium sp.]|nr:alpha-ribazole phosphatase [Eubacterium sp.]
MRIYLVRHGETIYNKKKCYYGVTDVPLSDEGSRQIKEMVPAFGNISFDRVISSPLKRAVETASILLNGREIPLKTDDRLMEQNFGIFEGYTYKELSAKYPEELSAWNQDFSDYRIPEGESFSDVRKRIDTFIKDLSRGQGSLLITAHKGTFGHMLAGLLGLSLTGYWNFVFDQGCYSCIDLEDGYAIIRCLNRKCTGRSVS